MHIFLVEKGEGDILGIVFDLQCFFSSMESKMRYDFKTIFVLTCKRFIEDGQTESAYQGIQFLGETSYTMTVL